MYPCQVFSSVALSGVFQCSLVRCFSFQCRLVRCFPVYPCHVFSSVPLSRVFQCTLVTCFPVYPSRVFPVNACRVFLSMPLSRVSQYALVTCFPTRTCLVFSSASVSSIFHSVYTIQPCTSLQCHFIQSHICRVPVCSLWQNGRFWGWVGGLLFCCCCFFRFFVCLFVFCLFLSATAVTQGWNKYRNKSQHRKLMLESKHSRRSCRNLNLRSFALQSGHYHWAIAAPQFCSRFSHRYQMYPAQSFILKKKLLLMQG